MSDAMQRPGVFPDWSVQAAATGGGSVSGRPTGYGTAISSFCLEGHLTENQITGNQWVKNELAGTMTSVCITAKGGRSWLLSSLFIKV